MFEATANADTFSFNLDPPNTAENSTGETIRVTGAGIFDTDDEDVLASGSFKVFDASGALAARGTWTATAFGNFDSFGGPSPGFQGGVLSITVTLLPHGGVPVTGVSMSVTCLINAPPGLEEGTTVGDFTEKTGGNTLFNRH